MNRDEYERLKEAEKAHLRKVRQLKQQLRQAQRTRGLTDALRNLDTSGLDAEFEQSLQRLTEQNITSEARFELAMETLDEAAERERQRRERERHEAELQKTQAADLVQQMKAQMLADAQQHTEARQGSDPGGRGPTKTIGPDDPAPDTPDAPEPSGKSIGRFRRRSDD